MYILVSRPIAPIVSTSLILYGAYQAHKWYLHEVIHSKQNQKCIKYNSKQEGSLQDLPDVILQNIISYTHLNNTTLVNKRFHNLSEKNDEIELMKAKKLNKQKCFIPNMKELFNGNTLIIDPNRQQLNKREKLSGHQGPLKHIVDAVTVCRPGDVLLIHEATYFFDDILQWQDWDNQYIMFVGIGKVVIENIPMKLLANNHFENINFKFNSYNNWMIPTQLSLKQCFWDGMTINCCGDSYFEDCVFNGCTAGEDAFLTVSRWCDNVVIIGCTFTNFENCIHVTSPNVYDEENNKKHKLIIIGNTFKNNNNYPLVSYGSCDDGKPLMIKHNILKGFYALREHQDNNPNKIHRISIEIAEFRTGNFAFDILDSIGMWLARKLLCCHYVFAFM
eukprot:216264_1